MPERMYAIPSRICPTSRGGTAQGRRVAVSDSAQHLQNTANACQACPHCISPPMSIDDAGDSSRLLPAGVAKPLRSPARGVMVPSGDAPGGAPLLSAMATTRLHNGLSTVHIA